MYLPLSYPQLGVFFIPILAAKVATNTTNWTIFNLASGIFSTIEAGSSAIDGAYPQLAPKYPGLTNCMHKIQAYMWFPSGFICIGEGLRAISAINQTFSFFPQDWVRYNDILQIRISPASMAANIGGFVIAGVCIATALRVVRAANNYFWPENTAKKMLEGELPQGHDLTYIHPSGEATHQMQLVLRIAFCIASLSLNFTPIGLCCLALQTYSIVSIAQRQWVEYTLKYRFNLNQDFKEITLKLFMRVFSSLSSEKDNCGFCLEELADSETKIVHEGQKGVLMCSRHIYHLECLVKWFKVKMLSLPGNLTNMRAPDAYTIKADLPVKHLPSCPQCQSKPAFRVEGEIVSKENTKNVLELALVN